MLKKFYLFFLIFCLITFISSQNLNKELIEDIEKSLKITDREQAIINALKKHQFKSIARDENILRKHNKYFTHEIKTGRITDQKSTGRCWLYAMLNTIRPKVVKKLNMKEFKFSQTHLYFWDKMEKANFFLEKVINRSHLDIRSREFQRTLHYLIGDGGYWQNGADLVKKYGCVPQQVMPEVISTENSRQMVKNITYQLRTFAYFLRKMKKEGKSIEEIRKKKKKYLKIVYKMLVFHLGNPVKEFKFRYFIKEKDKDGNEKKKLTPYKTYTPQSFYKNFVKEDLDDFVMFSNWPARDYYKLYHCKSSNNLIDGTPLNFINLPMNKIKEMMKNSILGNDPVNFSADVKKQHDTKIGIMEANLFQYEKVYGVPFNFDKKVNTVMKNINSTHAMVILGLDLDGDKVIKWKVENSWGDDKGDKGICFMYDNWVDLYVVRVVIKKKYIPKEILELTKQKPIIIPEDEPEQY